MKRLRGYEITVPTLIDEALFNSRLLTDSYVLFIVFIVQVILNFLVSYNYFGNSSNIFGVGFFTVLFGKRIFVEGDIGPKIPEI